MVDHKTALQVVRRPDFIGSPKYAEQQLRASPEGVHPAILAHSRQLIKKAARLGVPLFVHCYWRNKEEQTAVYIGGKSNAKWLESPHNYGMAYDVIHGTLGWDMPKECWDVIHQLAKETAKTVPWINDRYPIPKEVKGVTLTYGHEWGWDSAHIEIKNWRQLI